MDHEPYGARLCAGRKGTSRSTSYRDYEPPISFAVPLVPTAQPEISRHEVSGIVSPVTHSVLPPSRRSGPLPTRVGGKGRRKSMVAVHTHLP